jgi:senataxin
VSQGTAWKQVEESIIRKSRIVCTTLAMSGIDKLEGFKGDFEYLIVDEACQAIEPACLVPFGLEPKRIILVGDQKQLPATTISENSERTKFARSFFERLLDNGFQRQVLTVQYRMHPEIR